MSFTLCTSAGAILKAGVNANSDIVLSAGALERWSDETEGFINSETKTDWLTDTAAANFAGALEDVATSHIANKIISYDMSGYTRILEAQTLLDVNSDIVRKGISFLKDKEVQRKMK